MSNTSSDEYPRQFVRAFFKFPRRLKNFLFTTEALNELHIYETGQENFILLDFLLKTWGEIPGSACLEAYGYMLDKDAICVRWQDGSFLDHKDNSLLYEELYDYPRASRLHKVAKDGGKCHLCLLNAMGDGNGVDKDPQHGDLAVFKDGTMMYTWNNIVKHWEVMRPEQDQYPKTLQRSEEERLLRRMRTNRGGLQ